MKIASIEKIINFGLENISSEEYVNVRLRDVVLVHKAIEELIRFFHNPEHYRSLEEVRKYMGDKNQGMYSILSKISYNVIDVMLPEKVHQMIDDGLFSSGEYPFYYEK